MKNSIVVLCLMLCFIKTTHASKLEAINYYVSDKYIQKEYLSNTVPFQSVYNTTFKYIVFQNMSFKTLFLKNVYFNHCLFDNVTGLNNIHESSQNVQFIGSTLARLDLENSFFYGSTHNATDFSQSNLKHSNFNQSNLNQVNFNFANLEQATFFNAKIIDPKFKNTNVNNAFFIFSDLEGDYELSNKGAITSFEDWRKAIEKGIVFRQVNFKDISMESENLNELIVEDVYFENVSFSKVQFKFSTFSQSTFSQVTQQNVSFYKSELLENDYSYFFVSNSDFTNAQIVKSFFKDCIFENVNFSKSEFKDLVFINCKFINCNFSDVKWTNVKIKKSKGLPKRFTKKLK